MNLDISDQSINVKTVTDREKLNKMKKATNGWREKDGNGIVKSKESRNGDYFPSDVIDGNLEKEHLKYGWGSFKPQLVFMYNL